MKNKYNNVKEEQEKKMACKCLKITVIVFRAADVSSSSAKHS